MMSSDALMVVVFQLAINVTETMIVMMKAMVMKAPTKRIVVSSPNCSYNSRDGQYSWEQWHQVPCCSILSNDSVKNSQFQIVEVFLDTQLFMWLSSHVRINLHFPSSGFNKIILLLEKLIVCLAHADLCNPL